jgi:WD40-like Beta Propeller Repeat
MRTRASCKIITAAAATLAFGAGCGSDTRVVEPSRADNGSSPALASHFSDWSIPENLGSPTNSAFGEQQPTLSKDGLSLYFASNRTAGNQNIWVAQRDCVTCSWHEPHDLGASVNSSNLEASPTLSRDEHYLFFASQRTNGHCTVGGLILQCDRDLWVSHREDVHDDLGWEPAVNLPGEVNTTGEEIAPSYFENEEEGTPQLFFNDGVIINGTLTRGDIYMSEMNPDGTWGRPSGVSEINMPDFADQRPSIAHNGLEIYFWSNRDGTGHIWRATRRHVSDDWSTPELLPLPINSTQTIQPYIHSHGNTETLLFVRAVAGFGNDLFVSQRTRGPEAE